MGSIELALLGSISGIDCAPIAIRVEDDVPALREVLPVDPNAIRVEDDAPIADHVCQV
jgi:hypothetical protein